MPPIPIDAMRSLWERAYRERAQFDHVDKDGISHTRDGTSVWGKPPKPPLPSVHSEPLADI